MDENNSGASDFEDDLDELALLVDYLAGSTTPRERAKLEARFRIDPGFHYRFEQTRVLWERTGTAFQIGDPEATVEVLRARVAQSIRSAALITAQPTPSDRTAVKLGRPHLAESRWKGSTMRWTRGLIAASVLTVAAVGSWRTGLFGPGEDTLAGSAETELLMEFVSDPGQRRTISLLDGTRIILAPGSILRTHDSLYTRTGSREVHLEGHAYFEVASDEAHPFLVHTSRAVTQVIGTEFDVRAYRGTAQTEVLVRSGRVALRSTSSSAAEARVLTSGNRGTVEQSGAVRVQSGVDTNTALAWAEGTLIFRAAPVPEVISELEHWYGLRISLTDPALAERRITAAFTDEPVDVALQAIGDLLGARWQRTNGEVVLSPR